MSSNADHVPLIDRAAVNQRLAQIGPAIERIDGWLNTQSGGVLYQLARFVAPVPLAVELGSWKGRSTAWIAQGLCDRGGGRLVAVDTWVGTQNEPEHASLLAGYAQDQLLQEFRANLAGLGLDRYVEPWRMTTLEAARRWDPTRGIGLLHIDADHAYEAVRADFEHWSPYIVRGGLVVFDDVPSWPGPCRLVTELPRWYRFFGASPNQMAFVKE